jgi:hypothetical protein
MSQVPRETQNHHNCIARYLFLVFLAQIRTLAHLTYDDRRMVIPLNAGESRWRVHRALGGDLPHTASPSVRCGHGDEMAGVVVGFRMEVLLVSHGATHDGQIGSECLGKYG